MNIVQRTLLPEIAALDLLAHPPRVTVPVHYVFGEQDALTPASVVTELPAAIAAPASTVVRVPDAGHMVHFDQPRHRPIDRGERMKLHAIQTGSVRIKTAQVEGRGRGLRRRLAVFTDRHWTEWLPTYAWVIDHPEGVIVVDTGQGTHLLETAQVPASVPAMGSAVSNRTR